MIFHMLTPWGILVYLGIANVVCWVPYWHLVAEDEDFARTKDHLWVRLAWRTERGPAWQGVRAWHACRVCLVALQASPTTPVLMCVLMPCPSPQRLASAAVSLLRLRTLPGALYLLLAIVFAATGLACVLAGAHEVRSS